jgi:hypothetical protein
VVFVNLLNAEKWIFFGVVRRRQQGSKKKTRTVRLWLFGFGFG